MDRKNRDDSVEHISTGSFLGLRHLCWAKFKDMFLVRELLFSFPPSSYDSASCLVDVLKLLYLNVLSHLFMY